VTLFILPPIFLTLWNHASPYPLQTFLYLASVIYAVDLANLREFYIIMMFISAFVMILVNAISGLLNINEDETASPSTMLVITRILCETMIFICVALWGVLQANWLRKENAATAQTAESALLSVLVPLSVSLTLFHMVPFFLEYKGPDWTAKSMPYVFCGLLTSSMLSLGSSKRSVSGNDGFIVRPRAAKLHVTLLLLVPPVMFSISFYQRIFSKNSIMDVWLDLILVWCVPYLLLYLIHILQWNETVLSPYRVSLLFGNDSSSSLRGAFIPIVISLIASLALEYEYLIPLCRIMTYNFKGHDVFNDLVVSFLLTGALLSSLFAFWVYGRNSANNNEPLFGEYQDDVVQLSLALAGLLIGKAVGMPWSLTPLPILALLGIIIWINTRMLRYLAMLLFVFHSTAMVLWSYRYAGIDTKMEMVFGFEVNLFQFGMLIVGISLLVFLVTGLAVRSNGGIGHGLLRQFDICGLFLFVYTFLESSMECILLKYPIPFQDLAGVEVHNHPEDNDYIYQPVVAYATSVSLCGLCFFLQYYKIISTQTALPSICLAIGKLIAVFIDIHMQVDDSTEKTQTNGAPSLLFRFVVGAGLLFTILAPRAFLSPFRVKFSRARQKLPAGANRILVIYGIFLLPFILIFSAPWILQPLVGILSGKFGDYYITTVSMSETLGWACTLWGLALLSTINQLLPDEGGELWKKSSALTFLMGLLVALAAPTIPPWMQKDEANKLKLNPFASFSSQSPLERFSSHAGGWGLLASALATLLAITGPLDLKERHEKGDRFLLLRTMVFSVLFGCGISWFVTLELMSHEAFLPAFPTVMASMAMSFFGTVGGVLSYTLELKDFEEAKQVLKVWIGAFPLFLLTAATAQFVGTTSHPFGVGGWLSTYLSVCGLITLSLCLTLRSRNKKNSQTRGIANSSCVFSWLCWISILFGRYGVAGMDADFGLNTFFGIPMSMFGTVATSVIFLCLEDERLGGRSSDVNSNRHVYRTGQSTRNENSWMYLNFKNLSKSNRLAPPLTAISLVLVSASLYSILLRGFSPVTRQHVFDSIFKNTDGADDLASLAKKNLQHRQAVQTAVKLYGTSFWTAPNILTPVIFLIGVASTIPSIYCFIQRLWSQTSTFPIPLGITVPLNLIPIIFCRDLPPLFTVALIGFFGGLYRAWLDNAERQQSNMRI